MPQDSVRARERVDESEPLLATLPAPDHKPLWRSAWTHRRQIGLVFLLLVIALPPTLFFTRPAVVFAGFAGGMTGEGPFEDGSLRYQMVGLENRMPYDVTITSVENAKIEFMSPPSFVARVGPLEKGTPEELPKLRPFTLRAHERVAIYFTARELCPKRVMAVDDGFATTSLSWFRVHYRAFGIPMRVDLSSSWSDFGFRDPTSKDCPSSQIL